MARRCSTIFLSRTKNGKKLKTNEKTCSNVREDSLTISKSLSSPSQDPDKIWDKSLDYSRKMVIIFDWKSFWRKFLIPKYNKIARKGCTLNHLLVSVRQMLLHITLLLLKKNHLKIFSKIVKSITEAPNLYSPISGSTYTEHRPQG